MNFKLLVLKNSYLIYNLLKKSTFRGGYFYNIINKIYSKVRRIIHMGWLKNMNQKLWWKTFGTKTCWKYLRD